MIAVSIKNLSFQYKNAKEKTLKDINLEVHSGEIVALLGHSGCGKSTLCNCICGLIPNVYEGEYSGDVFLFEQSIQDMSLAQMASNVGIIFQNPSTQLFSPTIEDELAFGPENLCVDPEEIGRRMDRILKTIHMEKYRYDNPNHLSGGQQQLIAIASVLMLEPKILICDEIMSWIDADGKIRIKELLFQLKAEGKTIIMVDHDKNNAKVADRIIYI